MRLEELEAKLAASKGEVVRLQPQLVSAIGIRDRGFGYEYIAGLAHLKAYLQGNPRTNLRRLTLDDFKPTAVAIQFTDSLGHKSMPDVFMIQPIPLLPGPPTTPPF